MSDETPERGTSEGSSATDSLSDETPERGTSEGSSATDSLSVPELKRPRRLHPGDRVAVVAPSGPVPKDRLDRGCTILRGWGLDVVVAPHVTDVHDRFAYLAGSDAVRAADLQAAWLDPSVAGVFCARGGYGVQRMLELVDWEAMRSATPKVFAGYSDITALHEAFANSLGVATLHAPMVDAEAFVEDEPTAGHFRRTLLEPEATMKLSSATAQTLTPGVARGVTVGGCLSLLAAEIGTPTGRPNVAGGILLWRTSTSGSTGWTGSSPTCSAAAGWTASRASCWGRGRSARTASASWCSIASAG